VVASVIAYLALAEGDLPQRTHADDPLARLMSSPARAAGGLLALAALPLVPTLFAPFFADDYLHIDVASRFPGSLKGGWVLPVETAGAWWTPHGLQVEYFRPLVVVSFAVDRLLYGLHPSGYHLTNLILHSATTLLVWGIARHVIGRGFGAWAAAALFAVHPCHAAAVDWISGRTDVVATAFAAGAFLLYLEGRPLGLRTAPRVAASLGLFVLALLAKEMAITLPLLMLLDGALRPEGESRGQRIIAPAMAGAAAVAYLVLRVRLLGGFHTPPEPFAYRLGDPAFFRHLVTAPVLYLTDFVLFVPPDPMVSLPFWNGHPAFLAMLAATVLWVFWGTLRRTSDSKMRAWGLGWIAISLLPVMALTVGEHFLYFPSIGYCVLVGSQLPASVARIDAAMRRALAGTGIGVLIVCVIRILMFDGAASVSDRAVNRALEEVDHHAEAKALLVADLPAGASLTFPYAIHLSRPGRELDVQTLSIAPYLLSSSGTASTIAFRAADRLEFRREDGFLHSYIERALEGPRGPFVPGETVERGTYSVTIVDAPQGTLRSFAVRLHDPATALVLQYGEHGMQRLAAAGGS
jgi:hypothetical protein